MGAATGQRAALGQGQSSEGEAWGEQDFIPLFYKPLLEKGTPVRFPHCSKDWIYVVPFSRKDPKMLYNGLGYIEITRAASSGVAYGSVSNSGPTQ